jgi:porphobilinogen synthase
MAPESVAAATVHAGMTLDVTDPVTAATSLLRRPRRLRRTAGLRSLVRETHLRPEQLVLPIFVVSGRRREEPIASLPGVAHLSSDRAAELARRAVDAGIGGLLLFGVPDDGAPLDEEGSLSWDENGPVAEALRAIRAATGDALVLMTDVCLCAYTSHGHCGVLDHASGEVLNDETLPLLGRMAVSHARAGADMVAPSDMMDGRVAAIRAALDAAGHSGTAIFSYSTKFASGFYGPFRDAAHSAPSAGDRKSYQMDPANADEAILESLADEAEGADVLMVKPAGPYLDVIARLAERTRLPIGAYQVSGEYAMLHHAARAGALDYRTAMLESLLAIRRAGARILITYAALDVASWLAE